MPPIQQQIEEISQRLRETEGKLNLLENRLSGQETKQIISLDVFGDLAGQLNSEGKTIATTGNTDFYVIAPVAGGLVEADFSGTDALAANDTNFITFSIVNLGRAGSGTTNMLSTGDGNTTKATGGTAISADTVRELIVSTTQNAGVVVKGDRLRIRVAVTGTLANTVTNSVFTLRFK